MFSRTNIRIRGLVMAFGGAFLAGFMIVLGLNMGLDHALFGGVESIPGYHGSPQMLKGTVALFGVIIAFAISIAVLGAWMLIFAMRNRIFGWIAIVLGVAISVVGIATYLMM